MRVSKDGGQTFFEIGDTPEEQAIASQKGYRSYMTMTKDGSDHYDIEATPEQLHIAEQKGYMSPEAHQNLKASQPPREAYPKAQSAMQGATSTMTMGFDDELSGVGSGIKAAVAGKNPMDAYRNQRDAYRHEKEKSQADNPWTYGGASFAAGMALPGGAATKGAGWLKAMASGAKVGAAQGAVTGIGDAERIEDIPESSAKGAGFGAMSGAAGGALAKGVGILMSKGKTPKDVPELEQLTDAETGQVWGAATDNAAPRRKMKIGNPNGKIITQRNIDHAGKALRHEVYKDGGEIVHSLVDENGNRMAEIRGNMKKYNGQEGFAVKKSSSSEGSQGHGKKLYDLALDTHGKVFSDTSLSPEGARPVYEKHFPNQPGVEVTPDTRGKKDRFQVDLKDREGFRQKGGIEGFDAKGEGDVKKLNKVTLRNRLGFDSGSPESESSYYGNWDDGPSKKPTEALEELTPEETGKVTGGAMDNLVGKRVNYQADEPTGKLVMDREINHNGQKLRHEIYKDGSEIQHFLVDETGNRVADIKGKMHEYKGDTGLAIHWGGSSTKGQAHGKKLYDLVLDTHNKVFSDTSLSPDGSRKVYEDHYAYSPGVRVDFDTRHTPDRFKVNLKNPDRFRTAKGIDPWPMDHEGNLKDINAMPEGYRPQTGHDTDRYDAGSDTSLARANERAVADFLSRVRRGEDPSRARVAVADAHPGASPYSVGLAARQYRERMAKQSERIEQHTKWVLDQGGDRDVAVDYVRSRGFRGPEAERLIDEIYARPRSDDGDWRYRNRPAATEAEMKAMLQMKKEIENTPKRDWRKSKKGF